MRQKVNIKHHIIFWIFYILALSISEGGYGTTLSKVLLFEFFALPFKISIVYFNWLYLVPIFFNFKNISKYLIYVGFAILSITLIFRYYSMKVSFPYVFPEFMHLQKSYFQPFTLMQIFLVFLMLIAMSTCWQLYMDWLDKQRIANTLQIEKKETELKYLKSQINPHFLFNTLNTIYSLSLEKSNKVPKLLLKLSDFLSFSLYETNQETISVHKEIELIENFIELQKDRFVDRVNVDLNISSQNKSLQIPPMLLITFVENAFKHSLVNEIGIARISIQLKTRDRSLTFLIKNSKSDQAKTKKEEQGIGLKNIRRRLDLIYNDQYSLNINDNEYEFKVLLRLNNLNNGV